MRQFLLYAVLGAFIVGLFFIMSSGTNAKVNPDKEGNYHLKMNKVYLLGGGFALIIFVAVNILLLSRMQFDKFSEEHVIFLVDLFVIPVAIYSILSYYRHKLSFNSDEFTVYKTNGTSYTFSWNEVEDISYNAFNSSIIINSKKFGRVRVNQYLVGFKSFIEMLDSRTEIGNVALLKTRLRMD